RLSDREPSIAAAALLAAGGLGFPALEDAVASRITEQVPEVRRAAVPPPRPLGPEAPVDRPRPPAPAPPRRATPPPRPAPPTCCCPRTPTASSRSSASYASPR